MPRKYPSRHCSNPECNILFVPHRRNQLYCTPQCRINFNNDKRREKNLTDYATEKIIKKNEEVLKKLLSSPFCKKDEISMIFLQHEGYDFKVSSDSLENKATGQTIRWCHTHGIELKSTNLKIFVIHKRNKITSFAKS